MGYVKSLRRDNTGIGYTLEYYLGIPENNFGGGDFIFHGNVVELKARRNTSTSRVTLFTKVPNWDPMSTREIIERYGYIDEKGRQGLKNTLSTTSYTSQGLKLELTRSKVLIVDAEGNQLAYFDNGELQEKFTSKFGRNMLLVGADVRVDRDGIESFHYNRAVLYENLLPNRFWEMLEQGDIVFDFRFDIREHNEGFGDYFVRDHGPGFRVLNGDIGELYESYEVLL